MVKNIQNITILDFLRNPRKFNLLVKSTSTRYLPDFLKYVKSENDKILDVGSGSKTVVPDEYQVVTVDINPRNKPDIVANALEIPVKNKTFKYIVCSWCFEHLEEPEKVLDEFYRILTDGGYLYLTANMAWHIHERPRDFYRFTEYGLQYLFSKNCKWEILSIKETLGFWGTITQLMNYKLAALLRGLHPLVTVPMQIFGLISEKLFPNKSLVAGYAVIARKKCHE